MPVCEKCGNDYDKAFEIVMEGKSHNFDSFECAIASMAPRCHHCGCPVIGHGTEASGVIYCCANCASQEGIQGLRDRNS